MTLRIILEEALSSNNQCIERLQSDNLLDGVNILHHALSRMKTLMTTTRHQQTYFIDLDEQRPPFTCNIQLRHEPLSAPRLLDCRCIDMQNTESFVTCNRPLLLFFTSRNDPATTLTTVPPEELHDDDHPSLLDVYHLLCSVLLLNVAIILHHYGCSTQNENMRCDCLIRSFKLYTLLIELQSPQSPHSTDERTSISSNNDTYNTARQFALMITLNNMGHLSLILCNRTKYDQAMILLEQMMFTRSGELRLIHMMNLHGSTAATNSSDTGLVMLHEIRINVMCWKFGMPSHIALAA